MSQSKTRHARLLIIGSGPAGYTTAIYAARAMLSPVLISGFEPGGQLMITTDVENYPGFADPVMGPDLMAAMLKQAENVGAEIVNDLVTCGALPISVAMHAAVGDSDWFLIDFQAGHAYRVDLEGADTDGGTLTDPYFRGLYDSSGALPAHMSWQPRTPPQFE